MSKPFKRKDKNRKFTEKNYKEDEFSRKRALQAINEKNKKSKREHVRTDLD